MNGATKTSASSFASLVINLFFLTGVYQIIIFRTNGKQQEGPFVNTQQRKRYKKGEKYFQNVKSLPGNALTKK